MRTIPYSQLERGLAAIAGIDPDNLLAHEKVMFAEYINDAIKYVWDYFPWPETTSIEKRYFREIWSEGGDYEIGDEVFHDGLYYRKWAEDEEGSSWEEQDGEYDNTSKWSDGERPENTSVWHTVADIETNLDWSEEGVYYVGAKVTYRGDTYLCIKQLNGSTSSGLDGVNYEQDGITPENINYWSKIDTRFERYIPYEQQGQTTIGTLLSAHTKDPRYEVAPPLNWVELREGIYVSLPEAQNYVWLKYREEAPNYSSDEPNKPVLNFLAPAVKSFAYKAFLIGDGQAEKATLVDQTAITLLTQEIDKLSYQQDRGGRSIRGI